ncbi:hypothetical protein SAMN05216582_12334 [Selenomonas ruminantium]|uniref:Uncharacterized protein n=1 Tax=Selenomonas ruminantium TaxID=971 RepID=A0A1M6W8V6_SELRU|nr:hypothetical protein [Selenomonas ruminantium]SHK90194.1 hypothetical protein SAMN05216582_12334 [Selenomonas ruminantium]
MIDIAEDKGRAKIHTEFGEDFAEKHQAGLTVMEGGEHWFHTEEQMAFLDAWIRSGGNIMQEE